MPIATGECADRRRALDRPSVTTRRKHDIEEHWRAYKTSGSVTARNHLVAHYMQTHVRPIAARMRSSLPRQVELDDLLQQGYLGLIDAMDRFETDRDIRFETFSRQRISGAILDYLRTIDPVPRLTRQRSRRIQTVVDRFWMQYGRVPTRDELRTLLDVPEDTVDRYIADFRPATTVSFSSLSPDGQDDDDVEADGMDAFQDARNVGPERTVQQRDLQRWLTRGFALRDRLIIILYYYEQMTMRDVGSALGISESRVSQRLESIIACLRSRLCGIGAEEEFV